MNKLFFFPLAGLLLLTAIGVSAQRPQPRHQPFKFELTLVDAKMHRPRSTFFLGESVAVRISLTNRSGVARSIPQLPDTEITYSLHSTEPYEYAPETRSGYFGGTGYTEQHGNTMYWGSRAPRMMTIAPGQTVSTTVDLDGLSGHPLKEGTHSLTANYNSRLSVTISFSVVVDEARSFPLLEQLAAKPVQNGNDTLQRWASATLNLVREPSISGRVVDDEGQPLNEVKIQITGAEESNTETRKNGRYIVELLSHNDTYTITPSISEYHAFGETLYTFEPASKTVTVVSRNVTGVDFIARRVRVETNFASDNEGTKTKASSTKDFMNEPERAIDDFRMVTVGETLPDYWNDGTPNEFPDWIEVDFGVTRKINWINVFTLPDNLNDAPDPDLNQKFSLYGVTDFDVQYWTGRTWLTVPGGAIRGNRNVWRMIGFPEITTRKIRVVVLNALGGESRITEIEAIHLNDLPQAKIAVNGRMSKKNIATFTNSAVHFRIDAFDGDGKVRHCELDLGDKSAPYKWSLNTKKAGDKPQLTHSHVYTESGTYTVKLTVVDDSDEATETTVVLTVTEAPQTKPGEHPR